MTGCGAAALEITGLSVRFGGLSALTDVSLCVPAGEVTALIGPNGAGKTTLFNATSGFVHPASGHIVLDGRDLTRLAPWRRAALGLVRTFQHSGLVTEAPVAANVVMAQHAGMRTGAVRGIVGLARGEERELAGRARDTLTVMGLEDLAATRVADLPHGARKLVEVACALARRPRLVLLDEPSAGLDPAETADLASRLAGLQAQAGFTVLVIDHDLRFVHQLARRVVVLSFGSVLATGPWEEIQSDPAVIAAYLGPAMAAPASGREQVHV
jgi:ABC-type branched-subunit amino acid transport system ATPase component